MPTSADLITDTKRLLMSNENDSLDKLDGAIDNAVTTLTVTYGDSGIVPGATLAIDLEEMRIWSKADKIITVERGMNGTTAAAHADDALIEVRPRFSKYRILRALNDDLADLSSPSNGLYRTVTADLDYTAGTNAYAMPAGTQAVLEVRYAEPGITNSWPLVESWALMKNMPTTDFASGIALVLYSGGFPGQSIRVIYKAAFGQLSTTDLTEDVETTTGLPATAMDIPPIGAAIRLNAPREIKRNFTESQGDTRRAQEVPPGAVLGSTKALAAMRYERIMAESSRLHQRFPTRKRRFS